LPPPAKALIPTVHIAPAKAGGGCHAQRRGRNPGGRLRCGLDHPRWLYVLPNGGRAGRRDQRPERPEDGKGFKAKAMKFFQKKAGRGRASANRITLLRDADGDAPPRRAGIPGRPELAVSA